RVVVLPRRHPRRRHADGMRELLATPAKPESLRAEGLAVHGDVKCKIRASLTSSAGTSNPAKWPQPWRVCCNAVAQHSVVTSSHEREFMTTGIGVERASEVSPKDFERLLLRTLAAVKKGDFSVRMPV